MSEGFDVDLGSTTGIIAAGGVAFPNGMAITADGAKLIVGESFASRLGAWDIQPDASLTNRRVWAPVPDGVDGIAIDVDGAVGAPRHAGACECGRVAR